MYYVGLFPRFRVNRTLSSEERRKRVCQDKRAYLEPTSALSVAKLNSTYLELADKYYPWKGLLTILSVFAALLLSTILVVWFFFDPEAWAQMSAETRREKLWLSLLLLAFIGPIFVLSFFMLLKDSFQYTHYPIRLNRKDRRVYVFRLDGSVLEASWDDLFITMAPAGASRMFVDGWDLRAHVLDEDGETVLETFAFGYISDPDNLRHYFAYLQCYMDEGPQAVAPYTLDCLDIVDRRETVVFGFKRLWLNFGLLPFQLLMLPLLIPAAIGRVIAMHTSKIPQWPAEVEAANRIEPGDPWVRDARTHPAM